MRELGPRVNPLVPSDNASASVQPDAASGTTASSTRQRSPSSTGERDDEHSRHGNWQQQARTQPRTETGQDRWHRAGRCFGRVR